MRILMVSHLLPSPRALHAGGQVVFHLLRELVARGHTVDLVAKILPHEQADLSAVRDLCSHVITVESGATRQELLRNIVQTGLQHPRAMLHWRGRRNNLLIAQHLEQLLASHRYDLVQLEFVQMLPLVHVVRKRAPVLAVIHDLHSKLVYHTLQLANRWQRPWRALGWQYVLRSELRDLAACSAIATLGAFDEKMVHVLLPLKPMVREPIWLPIEQVLPPPPSSPPRLLFVGALWRPVNDEAARWLIEAIWPCIHDNAPEAELAIVGHGPSPALQALAANAPNVMLAGHVPDLLPWYQQAHVVIAPVRVSGGVLLKILDAFALNRPVVTTTAGNEGVGAEPNRDLLVADDPDALAASVLRLFHSPELAAELSASGRRFVLDHFNWHTNFNRYENFIKRLS
jgi:glycosyltransferase involved in cell wall biosynthesis